MHYGEETKKLWNRAEECRVLAQTANDAAVRFSYLSLAEAYETLAKQQATLYVGTIVTDHLRQGR